MILEKFTRRPVSSVPRNATLEEAAKCMRDDHVGALIVTEAGADGDRPVGILTDRDIVVASLAVGIDPKTLEAEDIMSEGLVTASVHDGLAHVIHLMKENDCRRIPIVDGQGRLAGIVSTGDLMAILAEELHSLASLPESQRQREVRTRRKIA